MKKSNYLATTFRLMTSICSVTAFLLMIISSELYASDGNPFVGGINPNGVDTLGLKVDPPRLDHGTLPVTDLGSLPEKQTPTMQTVIGFLHRVSAIGGETTGWAIRLDSPLKLSATRQVNKIEVSAESRLLESLLNRQVQARGRVAWRQGIERGRYPVLVSESIQELQ